LHPVIQDDDAVADVLLQAVAGQVSLSLLAGDDRGDLLVLEPAEEAAEFGPKDRLVGEAGEERLDGVEHDALRLDAVDRGSQPDEEALQSYSPVSSISAALDADVVEGKLALLDEGRRWKPREATLLASSSAVSSKERKTPGSWYCVMPRTKNSRARRVLPEPAAPQTRVGRPEGGPPP